MDVQTYALEFLKARGYDTDGVDPEVSIDRAADFVAGELLGMQLRLADLRGMAAMAQFSEREMRADVLQLLATTGDLNGDTWISMDASSVQVISERKAAQ